MLIEDLKQKCITQCKVLLKFMTSTPEMEETFKESINHFKEAIQTFEGINTNDTTNTR